MNSMNIQFEITEDGSHTFFVPELNEHYHSTHGAIQESMHVYIDAGLSYCLKSEVRLLEIGFGTGLNAFLTLCEAEERCRVVDYTSIELYPVAADDAGKLNYAGLIDPSRQALFNKLHTTEWEIRSQVTQNFSLLKIRLDFSNPSLFYPENSFDLIFFDAFAPDKQPEMWTRQVFDRLYAVSAEGGVLTTYCAKGSVRKMLADAGFVVERLPGPPGKREMLRAVRK